MPYADFCLPTDIVTELANLRDDCAESAAMLEVQAQVIDELRDEVASLKLERAVLVHALSQVVTFARGQRQRGNTYRRRALCLLRQVGEERTWADYYQAEFERMQRCADLDAIASVAVEG
jgi:hypothetical protein